MATERPVPSERNDTFSPTDVRRKTFEELRDTAFNADQIKVLEEWISGGGGGGSVVGWNQKVSEGVNIADITIDGETTPVYAPEGGADQVQSDWEQADDTAVDFIKNKPTIPDAQVQADWSVTSSSSKAFIKNKPTIPAAQVQADWNVTSSSSKAFIKNKPTIKSTFGLNLLAFRQLTIGDMKGATSYSSGLGVNLFFTPAFDANNYSTNTPATIYLVLPSVGLVSGQRTYLSGTNRVKYTFTTTFCTYLVLDSGTPQAILYFDSTATDTYTAAYLTSYIKLLNLETYDQSRLWNQQFNNNSTVGDYNSGDLVQGELLFFG